MGLGEAKSLPVSRNSAVEVTLKHDRTDGSDGTSNCFEEDVRIAIFQNDTDGTADCCASCLR